jgi:hypothetical protein
MAARCCCGKSIGSFIEDHAAPPTCVVLDVDVTDLPLHGHRQPR